MNLEAEPFFKQEPVVRTTGVQFLTMQELSTYCKQNGKGNLYMKASKIIGIVLIVAGAVGVAIALLADVIGIGTSERFGWRHIVTLIVGAALLVAGSILTAKKT